MKLIQPCSLIKKVALSKSLRADKWPSNNMFSENNMKRSSFLIKQCYCLFMNKIGNRGCEIVKSCWSKFDVYEGKICDEFKFCRFCAPNMQIKVGNVFFSEILFQRYSFKLPPQDFFQKFCWNSCIFLMVSLSYSKNIFDGCSLGVFYLTTFSLLRINRILRENLQYFFTNQVSLVQICIILVFSRRK